MLVVYFDASALVKRYSPEEGSALVDEVFARLQPNQLGCTTIAMLEVLSVLVRKRNDGRLSARTFAQALVEFRSEVLANPTFGAVPTRDARILASYELIYRHNINASDAIVLRSALDLRQSLSPPNDHLLFWGCDRRLLRAASMEGIEVFDPEVETLQRLHSILNTAGGH